MFIVKKKNAYLPFINSHRDSQNMTCGLYIQILVHVAIRFKYNYLLLINSSKLWQIPWHSVLNCKFRFYDWISRFHPRFLHRRNHKAVRVKNRVDRVLGTTCTWKRLVPWHLIFFSTNLVLKYRVFWQHYSSHILIFHFEICTYEF